MEDQIAGVGWQIGPKIKPRLMDDARYGFSIAKEISRLDIGQTVVVRQGTVLAVEGFEGTNDTLRRGGSFGAGAVAVKVSKPNQDMRFDVPVIGSQTAEVAAGAGLALFAVESRKTLLLEREKLTELAAEKKISFVALE